MTWIDRTPRMSLAVVYVLAVVLAAGASLSTALAQNRVALVIGNSAYRHVAALPNPANDAVAIAELLRRAGFNRVDLRRDLDIAGLRNAVRDFSEAARNADVAVVYYAGHGIEVDGTNFLIPTDARLLNDFDVEDETLSLDRLLKAIEPTRRLRLVILDACRENPFVPKMHRMVATRSVGRGLIRVEPAASDTLIAFAATAGAIADDGNGRNSPFTAALLKHLTTPGIDLRIAFGRVRDDVLVATARRQQPYLTGSLGGDLVSLAALQPSQSLPSEPPRVVAPAQAGPLRLAAAGPMTGASAWFGAQVNRGTQRAVDDINAAGGILGYRLVLEIGDDRADPAQGRLVAQKLAADGVKFVVGHFNSGISIPASDIYKANGLLEISPSSTNPLLTDRKMWNVFRMSGRDDQQGRVIGEIIATRFKEKRIAILHDKTLYGLGLLAEPVRSALRLRNIQDVLFEAVDVRSKDYSKIVAKLKEVRPDLVFWAGLHETGAQILRQMRDQGIAATFMGGDGIAADEFATIAGPGAEGTLMTFSPDPRTNPANRDIVEAFRKQGFEPQGYTLYSYAAVQIIKQAAEAANSVEPRKVSAVMHSGRVFHTVLGDVSFDNKGDVTGYTVGDKHKDGYVLYVWKRARDGRITYFEDD